MRVVVLVLALGACGSHVHNGDDVGGPDAATGDPCTGSETRCAGTAYQTCVDGTFQTQQACTDLCSDTLGCIQCDPSGGNACNGNSVVTCNPDGTFGTTVSTCGTGQMCNVGTCMNACTADGVDLVYVVDEQNDFMSFDPRKLPANPFTKIGTLACPASATSIQPNNPTPMPFSMSVDRDGVAWVLYTSGELFKVSLQDASCTAAGNTVSASNMALFGMGFSTDAAMGSTDTLFIAGSAQVGMGQNQLASLDVTTFQPTVKGAVTGDPELTGNGDAELWAFFPSDETGSTDPKVAKLDKMTGGTSTTYTLTALKGIPAAWAFAFWGGDFWVFLKKDTDTWSVLYHVRGSDGVVTTMPLTGRWIVGAGVSTCAPTTPIG